MVSQSRIWRARGGH